VLQAFLWIRSSDRTRGVAAGPVLGPVSWLWGATVALFTAGLFDGLWLVLVAWFVLSASTAEEHTAGLNEAMAWPDGGRCHQRRPDQAAGRTRPSMR